MKTIVLDKAALSPAALDHPDTDLLPYRLFFEALATRLDSVGTDTATTRALAEAFASAGDCVRGR